MSRESPARESGLTLVDTMIGAAIVVIVLGLAFPGFKLAEDTIATGGRKDRLERSADRLGKVVVETIRAGRIVAFAGPGEPPSFSVVGLEGEIDLAALDPEEGLPWGDVVTTIRFRETAVLTEEAAGTDLNRDGDRADSFALGVLERITPDRVEPLLAHARVLLALPGYAGDLDGDGAPDPLFAREDRDFRIRMFMVEREDNGRFVACRIERRIRLRNLQE